MRLALVYAAVISASIFTSLNAAVASDRPVLKRTSINRCESLFTETRPTKVQQSKLVAADEFTLAMARWKSAPSAEITRASAIQTAQVAKESGRLFFQVEEADLGALKERAGFKKATSALGSLDSSTRPDQYAIEQIVVGANGIVVLKPNVANGVQTEFGAVPLRTRLNADGSFDQPRPLFTSNDHPLRLLDATHYRYDLHIDRQTGAVRVLSTIREKREGDSKTVIFGQADAFFTDAAGRELPSLARQSGYLFDNVVALSNTLYATEVNARSPNGRGGQIVFFEYEPISQSFQRVYEYEGTSAEQATIARLLRQQTNRDVAEGVILENGLLEVTLQSQLLRVETAEAMGTERAGDILVLELPNRNKGQYIGVPDAQRRHLRLRVETTQTQAAPAVFNLAMISRQWYENGFGNVERVMVERYRTDGTKMATWEVDGSLLQSRAFRVRDGFIVQRDGFNKVRMDARYNRRGFPKGDLRGLVFLGDNGSVVELSGPQNQLIGAVSVVDGHVFMIGTGGAFISILQNPNWK